MFDYMQILNEASKERFIRRSDVPEDLQDEFIQFFDTHPNARVNWQNPSEVTFENLDRVRDEILAKANKKKEIHDRYALGRKDPKQMFLNKPESFEIVKETDKWLFVHVLNYEGAYFCDSAECGGAGAKWCIGWEKTDAYWKNYTERGCIFILAYNKKGDPKVEDDLKWMIQLNGFDTKAWPQCDVPSKCIAYKNFNDYFGIGAEVLDDEDDKYGMAIVENNVFKGMRTKSTTIKFLDFKSESSDPPSFIDIPEGVTELAEDCFNKCWNIREIKLPSTLKKIQDNVFNNLYNIQNFVIPASVETISCSAFGSAYWYRGRTITFEGDNFRFVPATKDGKKYFKNPLGGFSKVNFVKLPKHLYFDGTYLVDKTTRMLLCVFSKTRGDLTIPNGIKYIAQDVLASTHRKIKIDTLKIPSSVEVIGKKAFYSAEIVNVELNEGLRTIGDGAFSHAYTITLPSTLQKATGLSKHIEVIYNPHNLDISSLGINNNTDDYIYNRVQNPQIINGKPEDNKFIDGMSIIGNTLNKCSASKKGSAIIPANVEIIKTRAFDSCTNLRSVILPENLQTIEHWAFFNCTKLESLDLPPRVIIGHGAFEYCKRLTSITMEGPSINEESLSAFAGTAIRTITIPNGVRILAKWLFNSCRSLESVYLPKTVTIIGDGAFGRCESLKNVYYSGTMNEFNNIVIANTRQSNKYLSLATIHFSDGTYGTFDIKKRTFVTNMGVKYKNFTRTSAE